MPEEKKCADCRDLGNDVIAHRILRGGTALCDDHWRKRAGQPLLPKPVRLAVPRVEKEEPMPEKADVDWEQVRAEKRAGASAPDLARKYGVHVSSIFAAPVRAPPFLVWL